jgi:dolichol-phosphate mannosyltransferase
MVTKNEIDLTVILPSYLEEENLRILLPRINSVLKTITSNFEVLVVDTEKPMDHTRTACAENNATYINRSGGNTYGAAIRTGIDHANGRKIVFMDADGSHAPEFIENLYALKDQADIVIASRYIEGGVTENTPVLVFMSLVLNLTYSLVLNLKVKDVSNSFKLYEGTQLKELILECDNFDIVEEIIYKLSLLYPQIKIKEIPFSFKKRMFGDTKRNLLVFIFNYIVTIVRLRMMTAKKKLK